MKKYTYIPKSTYNQYGDVSTEEFVKFEIVRNLPLYIHMVGITHPNPNYFMKRKLSSAIVLEYIVKGKGVVDCEGHSVEVSAGDVVLLLPGKKHIDAPNKEDPYEKIWINFQSVTFLNIIHDFSLDRQFVYHPTNNMRETFENLLKTADEKQDDPFVQNELSKILYSILVDLSMTPAETIETIDIATAAYIIINNNIQNNIKIDSLSKRLNCSKVHLINRFKKAYGVTPYQYILNKKIDLAKNLLQKTNYNVCEISNQLTFKDEFHFSNIFKQKTGMSPSTFRKKIKATTNREK